MPPEIFCPGNIFQQVTSGNQNGATVFWSEATANDNSGLPVTVALVSNSQHAPNSYFVFGLYSKESWLPWKLQFLDMDLFENQ